MGKRQKISDSQKAIAIGIGMVHQHFMLVENFSVLENVVLGVEGGALLGKGMDRARSELKRLADEYDLRIDPEAIVEELPVGLQQRVEILKALYRGADILILDEPTGVLTPAEGRSPVPHSGAAQGSGQNHSADHPQAARDHGHYRPGVGHASR